MTTICPNCGLSVADSAPCLSCPDEPRASRMPPHMASVDPLFLDALNEFTPDERALLEKAGGGRG